MPKSVDVLMETETLIRWDESTTIAILWTASVQVRREWESFGFPVKQYGRAWRVEVPVDRITYRTYAK